MREQSGREGAGGCLRRARTNQLDVRLSCRQNKPRAGTAEWERDREREWDRRRARRTLSAQLVNRREARRGCCSTYNNVGFANLWRSFSLLLASSCM